MAVNPNIPGVKRERFYEEVEKENFENHDLANVPPNLPLMIQYKRKETLETKMLFRRRKKDLL